MLITRKRSGAHTLIAVAALAVMGFTAGCSGDSNAASDDPSQSPSGNGYNQAIDYAKCMRENGVPEFPDPEPGNDGRVVMGPGEFDDNPKAQAAQEACRDKMPQGAARDRNEPADASKVADWAACVRENGVPELPDPEVENGMIKIKLGAIDMFPDDPKFQKAQAACEDKSPGGSFIFEGGQ